MENSVDKYSSCGVPWWQGKELEQVSMEQQVNELKDKLELAMKPLVDALVPCVQQIIDAIVPLLGESAQTITMFWEEILKSYPDKRVVWLAFHHPKERVRKKNKNRICKWISKGGWQR